MKIIKYSRTNENNKIPRLCQTNHRDHTYNISSPCEQMKIIKYHAYVKQTTEIIHIILAPLANK